MNLPALSVRTVALCSLGALLFLSPPVLSAQTAADPVAAKVATPEELSQAELLKSYLQVRDQLHATQLAVVNNRVEAETSARVQAAAISEKLEAIKSAMAAERERHQIETQRLNAERERQQLESQRSIRTVLWVAGTFGCLGLLAMLLMPLFQWRAINRMAEATAGRLQLAGGTPALLVADAPHPSDQAVTSASQRLMSVMERMEARIVELETTASTPLPPAPELPRGTAGSAPRATVTVATDAGELRRDATEAVTVTTGGKPPESPSRSAQPSDQVSRISTLLSRARAFTAANNPREAVAAYDEILSLNPNHSDALVKKGAALERLMRNEEAIKCYDRAIEVDEKMTIAYLYKGGVCNRLGRYDDALECYELAMQAQEAPK